MKKKFRTMAERDYPVLFFWIKIILLDYFPLYTKIDGISDDFDRRAATITYRIVEPCIKSNINELRTLKVEERKAMNRYLVALRCTCYEDIEDEVLWYLAEFYSTIHHN